MADVERTRRILAIELLLKRIMTLQHEQDVARETIAEKDKLIERLVEDSNNPRNKLLEVVQFGKLRIYIGGVEKLLDDHAALLAELEGTPPKLADLKGIAPNCTGNKSSEDFVRDMRDEWDNEELEGKGSQLTESHGK